MYVVHLIRILSDSQGRFFIVQKGLLNVMVTPIPVAGKSSFKLSAPNRLRNFFAVLICQPH